MQACGLSLCENCSEELQREVEERTAQHEKELEMKNDEKEDGDEKRGSPDEVGSLTSPRKQTRTRRTRTRRTRTRRKKTRTRMIRMRMMRKTILKKGFCFHHVVTWDVHLF